ncbi:hypothetical protein FS837_010122 [Tulasnella sp. UAMH 9824]|nr:hypothetical protein FS837_010122 [Tulasnella sp. UAMH 9824]
MHSISDLTTFARKTKGHVPPQLVGASTTVVGNRLYLFGGRLVSLRRMVSDLYVFDLETFVWEKLEPSPDDDVPGARYFHSADSYNDLLVVFGGMGYVAPDSEELCVLNDVRVFDLRTRKWRPTGPEPNATIPPDTPALVPRARYAHLSSVTADRLFIIGGQDMTNVWLDDIHVYDLKRLAWVQRQEYPRHCGTYRSVAVAGKLRVRLPMEERRGEDMGLLGPPGSRFRVDGVPPPDPSRVISDEVTHLSYSATPTPEFPCDIMLYSNYNFTDVRRELEVISPQEPSGFTITDRSDAMTGLSLPPGLRFPTGAILGSHLIIAGTYLAHSYQSFSIWALDLHSMTWTRIDAGTTLTTGSWSRGVLWAQQNKFLIFGNRAGNLVEDYNRRLLSWDHVAYIDLEAFGIYQPPRLMLDLRTQELGLAALEERVLADFEIVCDDGRRIACSRRTLEERWPWFAEQRRRYLKAARRALDTLPQPAQGDVPLPDRPAPPPPTSSSSNAQPSDDDEKPDPRLMPRALHLSEPFSTTLALLQYIYSLGLITPLQHSPAILSALLLLSTTYKMPHLEGLVKHAMHKNLSPSSSVGVYESSSRRPTQPSSRSAQSGSGGPGAPGGGGAPDRDPQGPKGPGGQARPRGLSDANRLNTGGATSGTEAGYNSSASRGGTTAAITTTSTVNHHNHPTAVPGHPNPAPSSLGRKARRPGTADPANAVAPVGGPRSQLSVDTSFLNGEQRVSHSPDEITTATTTTTTTTTTAPSTARSASSAGPSNAAAHFLDGAENASSSLAPVSAVSAPTSNPFVVVSNSHRPDTAGSSASGSRSRPSTAPGAAAAPPPPPAGPPPPAVSDAEAQLQRAIRIEKRRMSRKAALAAHKMGGAGTDVYPTTEDEMAAMNLADEESDGEHGSDDGEDAYVGPEIDIHSAFPVPPTSHPVPIPTHQQHPDSSAGAASTSSKRPFSPKGPPQRSPPSSFVMGAPTPSPWNLMRRKASDVSTVSASTSSASSSRISGTSSTGSQSAPTGRRRAGSDATGSTDGPLTPPATGLAGSFGGTLNVGIVGGAFAVVNTNSSELLPPPGRLLDRIDESGTSGPPQTALPPVPDAKRPMQAPYINVPPEPKPMANLIDTRRPSAASSDSGYVGGPSTYTHIPSTASPRPSQADRLASPHPNPRDVHPDSELDVPGPRTGHRQTGSISGGSGGARSVATSDVPLQRNLTGTSSGDSMGSVVGLPYTSPMSPIPSSKIDKQVEKARKNLEKLERKAREQAAKDEKKAQENAEKMRKKITAQSAQEMFDRGRYMGVLGFR